MKIVIDELAYKKSVLLENIDLNVDYGEFISVLGVNGSGKSSFFKTILGDVDYKGNIELPIEEVGIVSDYSGIPQEVKVKDIYKFMLTYSCHKKRVDELIEMLDVEKIMGQKVSKLSSGEKRKVELIALLCSEKRIIIYDEVTVNLDKPSKDSILEFIKMYHKKEKNMIAFFASHDLEEICNMNGTKWIINTNEKKIEIVSGNVNKTELAQLMCGIRY